MKEDLVQGRKFYGAGYRYNFLLQFYTVSITTTSLLPIFQWNAFILCLRLGWLFKTNPMIPQVIYAPNEATIGYENNKQMGG